MKGMKIQPRCSQGAELLADKLLASKPRLGDEASSDQIDSST